MLKFLEKQKAATIAVPINDSGVLHAASLRFWNNDKAFCFYFVTSRDSEKYSLLRKKKTIPCAVVVGTEIDTEFTLQMRGNIEEVDPKDYIKETDAYYKKRGNHRDNIYDEQTCLLQFKPSWARYTDYSKGRERNFIKLI